MRKLILLACMLSAVPVSGISAQEKSLGCFRDSHSMFSYYSHAVMMHRKSSKAGSITFMSSKGGKRAFKKVDYIIRKCKTDRKKLEFVATKATMMDSILP
jgi:hypothetical protein